MSGLKLVLLADGFTKANKRLKQVMDLAKKPLVPAKQSAIWLCAQTFIAFHDGGRPSKWAPLSLISRFIRAHRADGPKSENPMVGTDTGRLKGSFVPVMTEDGDRFGSSTNVEYAATLQEGGRSKANVVRIAGFTRRAPGASMGLVGGRKKFTKTSYTINDDGTIGSKKSGSGASVKVKDYEIHFKGGSLIPARPYFPTNMSQLKEWGYFDKIREIFRDHFGKAWTSV